jgi:translation initiation factor IF-3
VVVDVADIAKVESPALAEGRTLVMMLTPVKK